MGAWPEQPEGGHNFFYFPEDALLGLSALTKPHAVLQAAPMAWLGRHGCWSPQQALATGLQAQVLVAGWAIRLPEAALPVNDPLLGAWCLQVASSSQQLVGQMAQLSYCFRHHAAEQSLASWLLMARHHSPCDVLQVPVASLQKGIGWPSDLWQSAWQTLHGQRAVSLNEHGDLAEIQPDLLASLTGLACACHQKIAQF